jgi:hypothetical protein
MIFKKWKKSLACISARKVIWKAPATTLPNTLLIDQLSSYAVSWGIWQASTWNSLWFWLLALSFCSVFITLVLEINWSWDEKSFFFQLSFRFP